MQPTVDTGSWSTLANTIDQLLANGPVAGLITIIITALIFAGILVGTVWAIVRVIRARKELPAPIGEIFNREQYALNILDLIRDISDYNTRRDQLSRKHERIREHSIVRDQMSLADANVDYIHSMLIIRFSEYIREKNPHYHGAVADFPVYRSFDTAVEKTLTEVLKVFRRVAKENHLSDKTEADFFAYIGKRLERIKAFSQQVFQNSYNSDQIPIQEVMKDFEENWKMCEPIYKQTFTDMRKIAVDYYALIETEEKDYDEAWSNFVSEIPKKLAIGVTHTSSGASALRRSER